MLKRGKRKRRRKGTPVSSGAYRALPRRMRPRKTTKVAELGKGARVGMHELFARAHQTLRGRRRRPRKTLYTQGVWTPTISSQGNVPPGLYEGVDSFGRQARAADLCTKSLYERVRPPRRGGASPGAGVCVFRTTGDARIMGRRKEMKRKGKAKKECKQRGSAPRPQREVQCVPYTRQGLTLQTVGVRKGLARGGSSKKKGEGKGNEKGGKERKRIASPKKKETREQESQ
ncbi:hypothetical protein B0H11DRAFT_2112860 [Mycena galericulata]|nr:hypothetical protein B0H11DRAFT_2112860 [Mycena galericulata]